MYNYEKALAVALAPCLENRQFRRAVVSRKLQAYVQSELKQLEEGPILVLLITAFKFHRLNWSRLNTELIKVIQTAEEAEKPKI